MRKDRRVVITGAAISSPAGSTLEQNFDAIYKGGCFFSEVETTAKTSKKAKFAGLCPYPDLSILPDKKVKKAISRKDVIALVTSLNAANNAQIVKGTISPERFGSYTGAASTHVCDLSPYIPLLRDCMREDRFDGAFFGSNFMGGVNPMVMLQTLMNNTLCYASVALDIRGVNTNFMDLQVSGLRAIGEGYLSILNNRADVVLAGGISNTPEPYHAEEGIAMGYLAQTDEEDLNPGTVIKPFDKNRSGTILSEASAFVVLEERDHALARGVNILGEILTYDIASDGNFAFINESDSCGLRSVMNRAISKNLQSLKDIGAIVAHANGSLVGDRVETRVYCDVLGTEKIKITSPKAITGETSEASGVISTILGLEILRRKTIPPTFNYHAGDSESSALEVTSEETPLYSDKVIVTARSFTGICSAMTLSI